MKIGLFGFGRAGRAVASILLQSKEAQLSWVIRKSKSLQHRSVSEFFGIGSDEPGLIFSVDEWSCDGLLERHPVDVIVDFSSPEGISFYGRQAVERGVAIVSAISQYPVETVDYIRRISAEARVLWSPNITIGINFLMVAAKILQNIAPHSDIEIIEEHFRDKKEVSGTARKIASALCLDHGAIKTIRAGGIVGRHEILFGFPYQTVRLMHESISRDAFGNGALFAAKNIVNKENGLYSMEDLLIPYFKAFS
jgi:4-hydroxy-tetrahydrodipicolinate reductase